MGSWRSGGWSGIQLFLKVRVSLAWGHDSVNDDGGFGVESRKGRGEICGIGN